MNTSIEKTLEMARKANSVAKELTLEVPKVMTTGNTDSLHEKALNMLLLCNQIETALQSLQESEASLSKLLPQQKTTVSNAEAEIREVSKLNKKLPKWARNPGQINSQILSSYLRLSVKVGESVTEEMLREEFVASGGNVEQFNKNFPQMKIIAERNHGKVFDVANGMIMIWPPAKPAVDEFTENTKRVVS